MLNDASPKTKELVTYMMSEGYLDWLESRRARCLLVPALGQSEGVRRWLDQAQRRR